MNTKQLKGLSVISIAEGVKLGTLVRAYLDPSAKRVVGFAYDAGGGLTEPDSEPKLDTVDAESLGPDVLTVPNRGAVRGEEVNRRSGELVDLGALHNRAVLTEGGASVGSVGSVDFDERTFAITQIEVAAGHFRRPATVLAGQIRTIGADFVVLYEATMPVEPIPDGETQTDLEIVTLVGPSPR